MLSNERCSSKDRAGRELFLSTNSNHYRETYFQLQLGIVLALPRVNACCSEPSASMVHI